MSLVFWNWMNSLINIKRLSKIVDFKEVTVMEIFNGEDQIFIEAWCGLYPREINALTSNKPLPKTNNLLSLWLFLSENLLWVGVNRTTISIILFETLNYSIKKSPIISTLGMKCLCQKLPLRKKSHTKSYQTEGGIPC